MLMWYINNKSSAPTLAKNKKNQIHFSYITSTSEQDMFERQFKNHIIIP